VSVVLLWVIGLTLCIGLPLNGLVALRLIKTHGAAAVFPPRAELYLHSAIMWAIIAAACIGAALDPATGLPLAWFAPPTAPRAGAALLAAAAIVAALAWWARDVKANRTKRAILRAHYRKGSHAVAPRQPRELAWFRAMALVTSSGEEIAYRFVLMSLASAALGPAAGLLASSAIFGLAHFYQGARGVGYTAAFGVAAGLLTLWADNLWPAIALHVSWNIVASGALYSVYRGRSV
jgi:membrane protease YdiL (CAAX protease family)